MPTTCTATQTPDNTCDNHDIAEGFLATFCREAGYRRCIVLEGNIRDIYRDGSGNYVTLPELLLRRLTQMKSDDRRWFSICGCWDHVDGLRFPDRMMREGFQRSLNGGSSTNRSATPTTNQTDDAYDDGSAEVHESSPADSVSGHTDGLYPQPEEAFPAIRRILSHETERAAIILDWSEHLVASTNHLELVERQFLTTLGKSLMESPCGWADSGGSSTSSGLVVIITGNLAKLPEALYRDNPYTKVIIVPKPDRLRRLAFLTDHQRKLRVAQPAQADGQAPHRFAACDDVLSRMADLADGLMLVDLQNLLRLSQQLACEPRPERLVNLYKFGEQRSPWEDLDGKRLEAVGEELSKRVIGQDAAIRAVSSMLIRAYMGLAGLQHSRNRGKPRGTLFFVGPTGVGKTELAKATAEFLFGDERACIRFDMSEYSHEHDDQRLVGAPPSYVGFEQGGQLTNAVRERPFCVLLFDEIEKAHPRILDKFLQILEDGRLTDGRGETAYFSETVIIFTSNIGAATMDSAASPDALAKHFKTQVSDYFSQPRRADGTGGLGRPELLGRLGENNIVVFGPIGDPGAKRNILRVKLSDLCDDLQERYGLKTQVADHCLDWLGEHSNGRGGRDLVNAIERHLITPLAHFLFLRRHQLVPGRKLLMDAGPGDDAVRFQIKETSP